MTKEYKGFLIVVYWSNKYMGFPFKIVKEKRHCWRVRLISIWRMPGEVRWQR